MSENENYNRHAVDLIDLADRHDLPVRTALRITTDIQHDPDVTLHRPIHIPVEVVE